MTYVGRTVWFEDEGVMRFGMVERQSPLGALLVTLADKVDDTKQVIVPASTPVSTRPPDTRRIIAIGRSVRGNGFVVTAPSLAYSLSMPHAKYTVSESAAHQALFAEGHSAYFARRGPGFGKVRALGWLQAHREEQQEIEARREERREQF